MSTALLASAAISQGAYTTAASDLHICLLHFQQRDDLLTIILVVGQIAELARVQRNHVCWAKLAGALKRYERDIGYTFDLGINGVMRLTFAETMSKANAALPNPS